MLPYTMLGVLFILSLLTIAVPPKCSECDSVACAIDMLVKLIAGAVVLLCGVTLVSEVLNA